MVKVKRMMETDENGVKRQCYPITDVSAVRGLEKIIAGQSNVVSVNNKTGPVIITKEDLGLPTDGVLISKEEYEILKQIIADYEAGKLNDRGAESDTPTHITVEKVGEI
ncbi:hypothetical protein [Enterococcus sp. DIV1420a]|uniref:hypothetical protein n=1 Tax=Enterococcus sp. DIV1420a TaxID=2774672 RepID=UPI003F687751